MPTAVAVIAAGFAAGGAAAAASIAAGATLLGSTTFAALAAGGALYSTVYVGAYAATIYGMSAAASALSRPSTSRSVSPNFGQDRISNTESTLYAIPIGYGRFKMGGNVIRRHVFGDEDNRLHLLIGLCKGEIQGFADPDLNDRSWSEMTRKAGYDNVSKATGTYDQTPMWRLLEGAVSGEWVGAQFTVTARNIASEADATGNLVTITASAAHYFEVEDKIAITGTTNYNGTYIIQAATSTTFDIIHSWDGNDGASGSAKSTRNFRPIDVNSYFITDQGFYDIDSRDSADQITCGAAGSGNRGAVDINKKYRKTHGSWTTNVFTRTRGKRFNAKYVGSFLENDAGEWEITAIDEDAQTATCTGGSYAGDWVRIEERGFSQAYRGLAYMLLQLRSSNKLGPNPVVTTVVEGKKCTPLAGGGAVFTRNPAVIINDFLVNEVGISSGDIDTASFQTVETYCNEDLGGGDVRYTLDFLIDAQRPIVDVLQEMLASCNGALIYSENKLKLLTEKSEGSVSYAFTMDNIVENTFSFWRRSERVNQAKITFADEDYNYRYETIIAKDTDDINLYGIIEREVSAPFLTRKAQASRLARFIIDKATRTEFYCQFTGGCATSVLEPWDKITISHDVPDWTTKSFRVIEVHKNEDGTNTFLTEEYDASVYHDDGVDEEVDRHELVLPPDSNMDHVENLALTQVGSLDSEGTLVHYVRADFDFEDVIYWPRCNIYISIDAGATYIYHGQTLTGIDYRIHNVQVGQTLYVKVVSVNWKDAEYDADNAPTANITITAQVTPRSVRTFVQPGIPDGTDVYAGDYWISTGDGDKLYLAASNGSDQIITGEWELKGEKGDTGDQGNPGTNGTNGTDGDDAITWRDAWTTSTSYTGTTAPHDAVSHNGSSYLCILNHTSSASSEPGVGGSWATYWAILSDAGQPGKTIAHNIVFTSVDTDTVTWGTGTLYFTDGTSQSITSTGTTGNMAALTYIYHVAGATVLSTSTNPATAMGSTNANTLLGIAVNHADGAVVQVAGGSAANTKIHADNIFASTLSAIVANLGTVTAGTITGVDGTFTNLTAKQSVQIGEDDSNNSFRITVDGAEVAKAICKRIDNSNYIETIMSKNGIQGYVKISSWPNADGDYQVYALGGTYSTVDFRHIRAGFYGLGLVGLPQFTISSSNGYFGVMSGCNISYDSSKEVFVDAAALDFSGSSYSGRFYDSGWQLNKALDTAFSLAHGLGARPTFFKVLVRKNGTTDDIQEARVEPNSSKGVHIYSVTTTVLNIAVDGNGIISWTGTNFNWVAGTMDVRVFAWR